MRLGNSSRARQPKKMLDMASEAEQDITRLTLPLPLVLWPLVFPLLPPWPFNFSAWPLLLPSQPSWPSLQAPLVCCLSAESSCP